MLPDFLHEWRSDRVEAIGQVLTKVVEEGRERVYAAVELGLPLNTVRNLCQRHRARAQLLLAEFGGLAGADLARLPREAEKAALTAAREGWEPACRRRGEVAVGGRWQWWSRVCGGRPLGLRPPTFSGSAQRQKRPEDGRITTEEDAHASRAPPPPASPLAAGIALPLLRVPNRALHRALYLRQAPLEPGPPLPGRLVLRRLPPPRTRRPSLRL